ncbi:hypothetical protein G5I_09646 [Acromyrmex echinatior]|uniref:Uncharacterized protein n=1 Tax=Acromyrmex echinatior TaxID=103372 RepID=F4WUR9_ACREC|nr:hypothetical protein G5I_09646 [Acromyrmex echinatior]
MKFKNPQIEERCMPYSLERRRESRVVCELLLVAIVNGVMQIAPIVFYGDTVNPVGLIAVDSVSVSRINLTDAQRWYREKEKGCIYKGKGRRSGTSHEQERRSHVVHFRNTLTAQSQPEGTWSVERMALSDVGVA